MNKNQSAAYVMGQAAILMGQVCGMNAENMQRLHRGEALAYVEKDFLQVIDESGCHHNAVMTSFRDAQD